MELAAQAHGQCIISGWSAAGADAETDADTHEQRPQDRSGEGHGLQTRPEPGKLFKQGIPEGEAACGKCGPQQEGISQRFQPEGIAAKIDNQRRPGGGDVQPVLQQQRQSQGAALGDTGYAVDIVKPEGQNAAAQNGHKHLTKLQTDHFLFRQGTAKRDGCQDAVEICRGMSYNGKKK